MKTPGILILSTLFSAINAGTSLSYVQICVDNTSCARSTDRCCNATKAGLKSVKLCAPSNTYDVDKTGVFVIPESFGTTSAGYAGYKWGCPQQQNAK